MGLSTEFKKLSIPRKVNLGVGIYRDEKGLSTPFKSVQTVEKQLAEEMLLKDYLPIEGDTDFIELTKRLVLGDLANDPKIVSLQTVGGTSALNTTAKLIRAAGVKQIHLPDKTWPNHPAIFEGEGLSLNLYSHLDWARLLSLPEKSAILVHAACHNPTGLDPTKGEWETFLREAKARNYLLIFDNAYQGFGEGLEEDAWAFRESIRRGITTIITTSFSKNFGLYGERVGLLSIALPTENQATKVFSFVKSLIRGVYSNPPLQGQRIITAILSSETLKADWEMELETRRQRIVQVRKDLSKVFPTVNQEKGFFSLLPLSLDQIERLKEEFGLLIVKSGRINVSGINSDNFEYVTQALRQVL